MLAPFVPYISIIGIILAVTGIVFAVMKKKFAFIPTYVLLILSLLLIGATQLPQDPGSWAGMVYALFGVFGLIATLIVFLITLLVISMKKGKIEEIK